MRNPVVKSPPRSPKKPQLKKPIMCLQQSANKSSLSSKLWHKLHERRQEARTSQVPGRMSDKNCNNRRQKSEHGSG